MILNEYPTVLTSNETPETKIEKILQIIGFARKTAELFVKNIPNFDIGNVADLETGIISPRFQDSQVFNILRILFELIYNPLIYVISRVTKSFYLNFLVVSLPNKKN